MISINIVKVMRLLVLTVVFSSLSQLSNSLEWGEYSKVREIYVKTDGGPPYIQLESESKMQGCYNNSGGYLYGNHIDNALSVILAAKMAGREIRPLYDIIEGNSGWSKCRIRSVYIR